MSYIIRCSCGFSYEAEKFSKCQKCSRNKSTREYLQDDLFLVLRACRNSISRQEYVMILKNLKPTIRIQLEINETDETRKFFDKSTR